MPHAPPPAAHTGNVLHFPANTFSPEDRGELQRWSAAVAPHHWSLQTSPDPMTGSENWVARADEGAEYITAADYSGCFAFMVQPRRGRWEVVDGRDRVVARVATLRLALEFICQTHGRGA